MVLSQAQRQVASDTHRFRVLNTGRRGGKTTLAIEEIKGKALAKPCKIAYVAPTYQQARDICWEQLKKELLPIITTINESRLEIRVRTVGQGESTISLRGWESIETLRGQFFDFIVIDEIAMMKNWWVKWHEVIRPTLTDRKGEALFISTPRGFNHFYDLYNLELKDEDFKSFHFTTYDNPYVPKEEIDKAKLELPEDRFAQEYLADFRKQEGLVYKEFVREVHLYDHEVEGVSEYMAGIDFGFTNPTAVIFIKRDSDNAYWVDDEWYKTGQTEELVGDYVKSCKFNVVYPDPESPSAISVLQAKGVNVREVIKNKDSIQSGINKIRELFKRNKLFIHKRCLNLIWELETYAYPERKPGHNDFENPVKENDHALDALRYAIMTNEPEEIPTLEYWRNLSQIRRSSTQNDAR